VRTEPYLLRFDEIESSHYSLVGGKGLHLAELLRAGLSVPPGFCLTTAAYRAFLSHNGLASEISAAPGPAIRESIRQAELPRSLVEELAEAYADLSAPAKGTPVAIRSSATAEDLQDASFAGQYDTFLNVVGLDGVIARVKDCWAGLWNERAAVYMRQRGLESLGAAMGVVVQCQVPARASGVLFTLNPLTGREEEMLIEAVWGLGEALVSGQISPDSYVVDAYGERVLERHLAGQTTMLVADGAGGVRETPVPEEDRGRAILDDGQLLRLSELGYAVQAIYGYPQDIEWALVGDEFVILQARPLTSFSFAPDMGQWTSGNYREILPDLPSMLSMSMSLLHDYGRALGEFFEAIKMGKRDPNTVWGRVFFGRPYWNIAQAKRFASMIPGYKERVLDKTVGIEPTYEGDGQTTPWTLRTVLRGLPVLLALNREYETGWQKAAAFKERFLNGEEPALMAVDMASIPDDELAEWACRIHDLHWRTNGIAIYVSLLSTQAQDDFEPMVRKLNEMLPPDEQVAEGDLITGLSDVGTARPTLELWQLAQQALTYPDVAVAVLRGDPAGIPERLQATGAGRAFWDEVQAYIKRYRYMAPVDEDLSRPRWDEDPSIVLNTLQAYARADESMNPRHRLEVQRQVRGEAEARAKAALSSGLRRLWPFSWNPFRQHLELVRRYVWWREEMRVVSALGFYHSRRFFLEVGRRWAERGLLDAPEHVFSLTWEQVVAGLEGRRTPAEIRGDVRKTLRTRQCYRNFKPPTTIGVGARVEAPQSAPGRRRFHGIPCSSGRVEGVARVAQSLEEAQNLQRGEILVALYTNPSWTPLFNLAAAIVIEEGGLLSHGAVVAREYGIPTVIRVEEATRIFHSGQRLRVDGAAGTVEIL
jgi:phosphohistidine swiveling domain-containing protein